MSFLHPAFTSIRACGRGLAVKSAITPSLRVVSGGMGSQVMANSYGSAPKDMTREEITETVMYVLSCYDKVDKAKVTPTADFKKDLGLDSLDAVEVVMAMEDEISIYFPDKEADKMKSVPDVVDFVLRFQAGEFPGYAGGVHENY